MPMATYMMATGRTTKRMDLANTLTLTVLSTKDIGLTISNTEKERNIGLMALSMRVNTSTEKRMDMDNFCGLIGRAIAENLLIIIFMAKVLIHGLTVEFTTETGNRIRCMEKVFSLGQMDGNTKASITMTRSKDMAYSIGLMEGNMTDTGCTESKKAWAFTSTQKEKCGTVDGKTVSASNGYKKRNIIWRSSSYRSKEECESSVCLVLIFGNKTTTKPLTLD